MADNPLQGADLAESQVADVVDEITDRINRGADLDIEAYVERYPHIAGIIRRVYETVCMLREPAADDSAEHPSPGLSAAAIGTLGDFRILREIGRGGMGVVYEAEQISLPRRMAIKVLPFAAIMSKTHLQRFKNEALAAASLDHPGIVTIHSVGCERGVHFYAMQLVEGQTLAEAIEQLRQQAGGDAAKQQRRPARQAPPTGSLDSDPAATPERHPEDPSHDNLPATTPPATTPPASSPPLTRPPTTTQVELQAGITTLHSTRSGEFFRTAARLGIQAAEALDHAHQHGIVHRDIKPANLLLDRDGHLLIADFGMARMGTDPSMTMTGDLLGTLRYMSPEQAQAKRATLDHRTDIYSLGVTLYELLTLEPAFKGHDRQQLLSAITTEEPPAPRHLNTAIPIDLETIVLKAIEKDPASRYATAQDLADDLQRFLDSKPIAARRPTLLQRVTRWSRRHRTGVATAIAATFGVLLAAAVLFGLGQRREAALRARSDQNLQLALDAVDQIYLQYADVKFGSLLADARPAEKQKL